MLISELIDHMTHVKEEYGDCKVFVLFKSLLEGTVITDVKDTAISRLPVGRESSETVFMLSNCPIVADREGTTEDAERILKNNTSSKQMNTKVSHTQEKRLFVGIEDVVSSFFVETEEYYIDYNEISNFHEFLFHKMRHDPNYDSATIDIGFDAFQRFAEIRRGIVELNNQRLYRKVSVHRFDSKISNPKIREFVHEFLKLKEDKTTT